MNRNKRKTLRRKGCICFFFSILNEFSSHHKPADPAGGRDIVTPALVKQWASENTMFCTLFCKFPLNLLPAIRKLLILLRNHAVWPVGTQSSICTVIVSHPVWPRCSAFSHCFCASYHQVIGPPGSGKTSYCFGLNQLFEGLQRLVFGAFVRG